jgi:hypothetical protein
MSVLEELELRAGASDEDRETWLAERAKGITATEVRDLAKSGGSEAAMQRILDDKRHPNSFDNKWVSWGRKREAEFLGPWAEHTLNIVPEHRVFHSAEDPRFLASPDGIGVVDGQLVLCEDKTSKHDVSDLGVLQDLGYTDQCQWQMFVTGATRVALVGEQHDDKWFDRGGAFPEPTPLNLEPTVVWIPRDEKRIQELKELALDWFEWRDSPHRGEDPSRFVDLVDRLRRARAAAAPFQADVQEAEKELREALTREDVHRLETDRWKVSFSAPAHRFTFDSKAFKKADPETFNKFLKESTPKPRLVLTEKEK